jgi:chemotaxis protein MotA
VESLPEENRILEWGMDIATLLGMLGALGVILGAIFFGGSASSFLDVASCLIVIGGGMFANLIKFPLSQTLGAFKVATRAFVHKPTSPSDLIAQCLEMSKVVRQDGLLGLEEFEIDNEFMRKGINLTVDGHDAEFVARVLNNEINQTIEHHEQGEDVFKGFGESFPAMGMIGTLVGLVQMMSNMADPKAIGPAMAVALLTTLYGAVLANAVCLPMAGKLAFRTAEERRNRALIIDAVAAIQEGINPRQLESLLSTYMPGKEGDADPAPEKVADVA